MNRTMVTGAAAFALVLALALAGCGGDSARCATTWDSVASCRWC